MKINDILYEAIPKDGIGKDTRTQRDKDKAAYMNSLTKIATWMGPNSKTWNDASNKLAVKMYKQGYNPKEIWGITQNIMGTDGNWRQEIDDSGSRLIPGAKGGTMGDQIHHPELYKAYPEMRNVPIETKWDNRGSNAGGKVSNGKVYIGAFYAGGEEIPDRQRLGTGNHEWGHVIQQQFEPDFSDGDNTRSDLITTVARDNNITPTQAYMGKGGEHMTSASELRHDMNKAERAATFPDLSLGADFKPASKITIDKTDKVPAFDYNNPNKNRNAVKGVSGPLKGIGMGTKHVTFDNPHLTDIWQDPSRADLDKIRRDLKLNKPSKTSGTKGPFSGNNNAGGGAGSGAGGTPPKPKPKRNNFGGKGKNGLGTMTSTGQVLDWKPKQDAPPGTGGK